MSFLYVFLCLVDKQKILSPKHLYIIQSNTIVVACGSRGVEVVVDGGYEIRSGVVVCWRVDIRQLLEMPLKELVLTTFTRKSFSSFLRTCFPRKSLTN